MRVQLRQRVAVAVVLVAALAVMAAVARPASAQVVQLDTAHSVFYEAPTRTHMFVYSPSVDATASP
jgi:hypothetical protein